MGDVLFTGDMAAKKSFLTVSSYFPRSEIEELPTSSPFIYLGHDFPTVGDQIGISQGPFIKDKPSDAPIEDVVRDTEFRIPREKRVTV